MKLFFFGNRFKLSTRLKNFRYLWIFYLNLIRTNVVDSSIDHERFYLFINFMNGNYHHHHHHHIIIVDSKGCKRERETLQTTELWKQFLRNKNERCILTSMILTNMINANVFDSLNFIWNPIPLSVFPLNLFDKIN